MCIFGSSLLAHYEYEYNYHPYNNYLYLTQSQKALNPLHGYLQVMPSMKNDQQMLRYLKSSSRATKIPP